MSEVKTMARPAAAKTGRPAKWPDVAVVLAWLAVLIGGGAAGTVVFDRLSSSMDPAASSESMQARHSLETVTGQADTIVAVVTGAPSDRIGKTGARLQAIAGVHSVHSSLDGQLPTPPGGGALLAVTLRPGLGDKAEDAAIDAVRGEFDAFPQGQVLLGGYPIIDRELGTTAEADLILADAVALPIVIILLGFAVRSLLGSILGLTLVLTTVTGALALLLVLSMVTTLSTFAINVVTMFGMGLAVDYGLLLISRFRRERANTATVDQAVTSTMATAGRTVVFSGLTVALALAGLLVFAEPIVKSMAYGGIGAVVIAVAASVTLMPVLLRRFGHRIAPAPVESRSAGRGFARLARLVQCRPFLVTMGTLAALAILAMPLAGLRPEGIDSRALPADSVARHHTEALEKQLPDLARTPITVVAHVKPSDPRIPSYIDRLRGIGHVAQVQPRAGVPDELAVIDVTVTGPTAGRDAIGVVDQIRALRPGFTTQVGGLAARDRDFISSLQHRALYAAALIALATFLVLLLVTGSVLIAAKAVAINLASLGASLGALVWIFQEGHAAGLLRFTPTGGLELVIVLLTAVFAFGLSTDYEVFLLSSIMAARRDGQDTDNAVATGIARTGRIITTAAILIVVVFTGFAAGNLLIIKQLGVGLAIAVLLDATLIRLALTPALMTLFKDRVWTGPAFARRASRRLWHH